MSRKNPIVVVLMKTFNGSKYIEEQLQSIMNQKNVEVRLYISDDGSSDDTVFKIKRMQQSFHNIFLISSQKNEGPAQGFLNLLKKVIEENPFDDNCFFAFADQDDIWYEQKLNKAVQKLEKDNADLFLSTYHVLKDGKQQIRDMGYRYPITVERVLSYWAPSGNVFVFTKRLAKQVAKTTPPKIRMHDFWTLLIAVTGNFKITILDEPLLMYRLHQNNTVGLQKIGYRYFKNLYKSAKNDKNIRSNQAKYLLQEDTLNITDDDMIKTLNDFSYYNVRTHIKLKLIHKKISGMNFLQKILFKISVILGVF